MLINLRPTIKMMMETIILKTSFCSIGAASTSSFSRVPGLIEVESIDVTSIESVHALSNRCFIYSHSFLNRSSSHRCQS